MNKVFEKIIEKLEEQKAKGIYDSNSIIGEKNVWAKAIEIVKHESEKYKYSECGFVSKSDVLKVIEDIKCNDNTPKNYGTLLDIMRKIRILPTVRYIDWIPCSERLPEERDWYLCVFEEVDTGFIGLPYIADYLMGSHTKFTTEDGWIIRNCSDREDGSAEYYKNLRCVAWHPLPLPYQPKGE